VKIVPQLDCNLMKLEIEKSSVKHNFSVLMDSWGE